MKEKFIKLKSGRDELYVDPFMITHIRKHTNNKNVLYVFGGQSLYVEEDIETILKLIKESEKFKFTFDKNDNS